MITDLKNKKTYTFNLTLSNIFRKSALRIPAASEERPFSLYISRFILNYLSSLQCFLLLTPFMGFDNKKTDIDIFNTSYP